MEWKEEKSYRGGVKGKEGRKGEGRGKRGAGKGERRKNEGNSAMVVGGIDAPEAGATAQGHPKHLISSCCFRGGGAIVRDGH